jgi:hypothetical protein
MFFNRLFFFFSFFLFWSLGAEI